MKRVATAAVLIPLVVWLIFRGPLWLHATVFALVAAVALSEYLAIVSAHGIQPQRRLATALVVLMFLSVLEPWSYPHTALAWPVVVLLLAPFVLLLASLKLEDLRACLPSVAATSFGLFYVGIGLYSLFLILSGSALITLYVLVVVWSGDIFAYYTGRSVGRRPLAPRISPKKTWEGTIASLVGSVLLGSLFLTHLDLIHGWFSELQWVVAVPKSGAFGFIGLGPPANFPLWFAVAGTAFINIAAQLGDLVESALKRGANMKDSGSILPGHGGLLDRIDALLLASPAAVLVFEARILLFPPSIFF